MKTLFSSLLLILFLCLSLSSFGQIEISLPDQSNDSPQVPNSVVGNPPGNCSFIKNFSNTSSHLPCSIYGYAKVIPSFYTEPCEADEECPGPPGSCPARADIVFNANWPLGCIPLSIVDNSHAHYSSPFLSVTFNGEVFVMLFGRILDSVIITTATSEQVGNDCCLAF